MRINGFTVKGKTKFLVSAMKIELMVLYKHETLVGTA